MSVPAEDYVPPLPTEDIAEALAEDVDAFIIRSSAARVLSVVAVDSTHVRVTWVRPLLLNPAASCAGAYEIATITPGARTIEVHDVVTEGAPVASCLLTVDEMLDLADYELLVHLLEEA